MEVWLSAPTQDRLRKQSTLHSELCSVVSCLQVSVLYTTTNPLFQEIAESAVDLRYYDVGLGVRNRTTTPQPYPHNSYKPESSVSFSIQAT